MDDLASLLGINKKQSILFSLTKFIGSGDGWLLFFLDQRKWTKSSSQDLSLDTVGKIRAILGVLPEGGIELDLRQLYQLKGEGIPKFMKK